MELKGFVIMLMQITRINSSPSNNSATLIKTRCQRISIRLNLTSGILEQTSTTLHIKSLDNQRDHMDNLGLALNIIFAMKSQLKMCS